MEAVTSFLNAICKGKEIMRRKIQIEQKVAAVHTATLFVTS